MAFFTKSEARAAARSSTTAHVLDSARILNESKNSAKDTDEFDIFLSHSVIDSDLVLGIKNMLVNLGNRVYVDWQDDPHLERTKVSPETAAILRKRMRQSKSLLYLATEAASSSKWMPWELGYFDGLTNGAVAIMPLMDNASDTFGGQEYLGLYPKVTKDTYAGGIQQHVFVEGFGRWTTLDNFNTGTPSWKKYSN